MVTKTTAVSIRVCGRKTNGQRAIAFIHDDLMFMCQIKLCKTSFYTARDEIYYFTLEAKINEVRPGFVLIRQDKIVMHSIVLY
jgi:hypothetical protein